MQILIFIKKICLGSNHVGVYIIVVTIINVETNVQLVKSYYDVNW